MLSIIMGRKEQHFNPNLLPLGLLVVFTGLVAVIFFFYVINYGEKATVFARLCPMNSHIVVEISLLKDFTNDKFLELILYLRTFYRAKEVIFGSNVKGHDMVPLTKHLVRNVSFATLPMFSMNCHLFEGANYSHNSEFDNNCRLVFNSRAFDKECIPPVTTFPLLVTSLGGSGSHIMNNMLRFYGFDVCHEELCPDGSVSWPFAVNDVFLETSYPHHAYLSNSTILWPRFDTVVHIVRCPMQQISSLTSHVEKSFNFIRKLLEFLMKRDKFLQERRHLVEHGGQNCLRGSKCSFHFAALSWLYWNQYIESYASKRFLSHELTSFMIEMCKYFHHRGHNTQKCQHLLSFLNLTQQKRIVQDDLKSLKDQMRSIPLQKRQGFNKMTRSSIHHGNHKEYDIQDIMQIDRELAHRIVHQAYRYGFNNQSATSCSLE